MIAEDGAEARRIAAEAHVKFHASLLFLWERTGVPIPTHFPHTVRPVAAGGRSVRRHAGGGSPVRRAAGRGGRTGHDDFHLAFGDVGFDDVCRTAELFAAEVMPAFADAQTLR